MNRWLALVLQQQQLGAVAELEPEQPDAWTEDEIVAHIVAVSDEYGMPPEALLALAIAESNLDHYARRPPYPAQDLDYWTDVSMGLYQQTVRWSNEYAHWCDLHGHPPDVFPGAAVIAAIGSRYYDPPYASSVAAPQLAYYLEQEDGDVLDALCRYNKPNMDPATNPNRPNYARGLTQAEEMLD